MALTHWLVVSDDGDGGLEYEVEHSEDCPTSVWMSGPFGDVLQHDCDVGSIWANAGRDAVPDFETLGVGRYPVEIRVDRYPATPMNGGEEWDVWIEVIGSAQPLTPDDEAVRMPVMFRKRREARIARETEIAHAARLRAEAKVRAEQEAAEVEKNRPRGLMMVEFTGRGVLNAGVKYHIVAEVTEMDRIGGMSKIRLENIQGGLSDPWSQDSYREQITRNPWVETGSIAFKEAKAA